MPASSLTIVPVTQNVEQVLIGPNVKRTRLAVFSAVASLTYVRPDALGDIVGGIAFNVASPTYEITREKHGDFVCSGFYVFCTANTNLAVLETID